MQYLSSGPNDDFNQSLVRESFQQQDPGRQTYNIANPGQEETGEGFHLGRLIRRYWLLLTALVILGAGGGFITVVLSPPLYRSQLMVELQNPNGALLRNGEGGTSLETSDMDIQTQVSILRSGTFRQRGAELMHESVPLPQPGKGLFSRLRQRIHPSNEDPIEARIGHPGR